MGRHPVLPYLLVLMMLTNLPSCLSTGSRPNVLFLVSDDMRPQLSCYDADGDFPTPVHPTMATPNLDYLAAKSILLRRAHVQQALCNPSRTSLLTGRRPDTTHVKDNSHYWRKVGGNYTTIPQYFKENGYYTIGAGKIFHPGAAASGNDDPISWSEPFHHSKNYYDHIKTSWYSVSDKEHKEHLLIDELNTLYIVNKLKEIVKNGTQPFFVALGIHKPHLPFISPEYFYDYYPESSVKLPSNPYAPVDMPDAEWYDYAPALSRFSDLKKLNMTGKINSTLPDFKTLELRRAYYAATSYADSLIGIVLENLRQLGLDNSTIVSFFGDHGWQLGEHSEWTKFTNFELSTHAPMMVHVPGVTDGGVISRHLVEFVDLFPTLVEAAGLPPLSLCPSGKSTKTETCREGTSFVPLMTEPTQDWKSAVFSQFPRSMKDRKIPQLNTHPDLILHGSSDVSTLELMGYSLRTDMYRYTEWVRYNTSSYGPIWDQMHGAELYDHTKDPEENWNHVDDDIYATVRSQLRKALHMGWRAALPNPSI